MQFRAEFLVLLFLCCGGLAVAFTGLLIRWSHRLRLTAAPRADRWHKRATPSGGGIAIFAAVAVAYLLWFRGEHAPIAIGVVVIWILGVLDDLFTLPPAVKFAVQSVVSAGVVYSGPVFHATSWAPFNYLFSWLWLVGITNAFNLIDNMDGLCAGVAVIISGFRFFLLAVAGDWGDAYLVSSIGFAYAGFLVWNYRPAKVFMGDCGSMVAGFSLAALTIATPLPHTKAFVAGMFYPALTFIYPIFDTMLVSILRRIAGRPISMGGRDHSSHRLVSLGMSESRAVLTLWLLTAIGSGTALIVQWMPMSAVGGVAAVLLCVGLAVFGVVLANRPVRRAEGRDVETFRGERGGVEANQEVAI